MPIDSSVIQGTVMLAPEGRLDSQTTPGFANLLNNALSSGSSRIVLDLSRINYMTSEGLRSILRATKDAKATQKTFVICGATGVVREVLDISGFSRMITMVATLDEAMKI
jgi:anti-anti-sigma factor